MHWLFIQYSRDLWNGSWWQEITLPMHKTLKSHSSILFIHLLIVQLNLFQFYFGNKIFVNSLILFLNRSICIEKLNFKLMIVMGLLINAIFFSLTSFTFMRNIYGFLCIWAIVGFFSINIPILKLLMENYITFLYE